MATQNVMKDGVSANEASPTISRQLVNVAQQLLGASQLVSDGNQSRKLKEDLLLTIKALTSIVEELDEPQTPNTAQPSLALDAASQFERLAGELRNRIYKLVLRLDPNYHFGIPPCEQHRHPYWGCKVVSEGLLRTRRGILIEAVSILYSSNYMQIAETATNGKGCRECWRIGHDALFVSKRVQKFEHVEIITTLDRVPVWIGSVRTMCLSTWNNCDVRDIMHCLTGMKTLWLTSLIVNDSHAIWHLTHFVRDLMERGPPGTLGTISIQSRHVQSATFEQDLSDACYRIVMRKQSAWTVEVCPAGHLPHNFNRVILQHRG